MITDPSTNPLVMKEKRGSLKGICEGGGQSNMVLSDPVSNSSFWLFMTDGVHLVSLVLIKLFLCYLSAGSDHQRR